MPESSHLLQRNRMPIWMEVLVLMLFAYAIGLGLGWAVWGRDT
ncbi:hypothetical protein GCM10023208_14520 [Erythrobacter westpacificensis]|uniref:Uncharacterized protein n=1 Tax=Erythrobacter westpacificensis TaxID=1055231 RepID=A0ABP9KA18_9SPHN